MIQTVTVELRNINALRLLKDLELVNIIRVIEPKKLVEKKDAITKPKLSAQLRGSISSERAIELNQQLNKMREEWNERPI